MSSLHEGAGAPAPSRLRGYQVRYLPDGTPSVCEGDDLPAASDGVCFRGSRCECLAYVQEIGGNPDERAPRLTLADRFQQFVLWNDTRKPYPTQSVAELIEAQVARAPDRTAVVFGATQLSYAELNRRANRIAHRLRRLGVGPEVPVGLHLHRSETMLTALLGILKAGGAYVPLDPGLPLERLGMVCADAALSHLVTDSQLLGALSVAIPKTLCLDAEADALAQESEENPPTTATHDNLAYILFTSGSTGRPKGVQVLQRGLVNFLCSMAQEPGMGPGDTVLAITTLSFDIAGLELWLPLLVGARVVIASREVASDGRLLLGALQESGATILQATPATWRSLLDAGLPARALTRGLCGGESMPRPLAEALMARGIELWNMYGPTETTVWSTAQRVQSRAGPVSIGRPIANTRVYILDEQRRPLPSGTLGECYIGGAGVARGYLNRPDLTSERFLRDPYSDEPDAWMYRTGDLARFAADGSLEFLGRADHQIKIRGYRVELSEIENRLCMHPNIRAAVVLAPDDGQGNVHLVGYVIPHDEELQYDELVEYLSATLPDYMVPHTFVLLDDFPLTSSGKVDRKALPAPETSRKLLSSGYVAPRTAFEARLQQIWEDVLGVRPVGVRDNFFELGGDSLSALRLFLRIESEFGRRLPMAALFENGTVERLTPLMESGIANTPLVVPAQTQGDRPKLFFVPGISGAAIDYAYLSQALAPDQPLYTFRARGLADDETPFESIEAMAAQYVEEIQRIQPGGPYYVGGWSFGAEVAHEIGCQLRARGCAVALLVVVDEWAPFRLGKFARLGHLIPNAIANVAFLFRHGPPEDASLLARLGYLAANGGRILRKALLGASSPADPDERTPANVESLEAKIARELGIHDLPPLYHATFRANVRALVNYVPGVYPGRICLIRCPEQPFGWRGPDMGWGCLAAGGIDLHVVPGDHLSVIRPPFVAALANRLRAVIAAATPTPAGR